MKLMKHCITALFSIIIGYNSCAQNAAGNSEIKEDSIFHMKNKGILSYEREVPECDLVEKKGDSIKIVCAQGSREKSDSGYRKTRRKAENSNEKNKNQDGGMVKNDSKDGFKGGNKNK